MQMRTRHRVQCSRQMQGKTYCTMQEGVPKGRVGERERGGEVERKVPGENGMCVGLEMARVEVGDEGVPGQWNGRSWRRWDACAYR